MKFFKYQGTGNDFILIDNRESIFSPSDNLIARLCDRNFGIGADGLILLEEDASFDFRMRYFNSDGREASMCGNGGRCIVAFARHLGIMDKHACFIAIDGEHEACIEEHEDFLQISLKMQDVDSMEIGDDYFYLNTGSPHYVKFIKKFDDFDVYSEGKKIRYNERFRKEGVNVNFAAFESNGLVVSTYERGVEDVTLSCGTGVVAVALSSCVLEKKLSGSYRIQTKGGELTVNCKFHNGTKFSNIWLQGPANLVFKGDVDI